MHHVTRIHDFSAGHRIPGHEGKCQHLHGHNYRVHLTCVPNVGEGLDKLGRVIDFSVIKDRICTWIDENWDHKFLMFHDDPDIEVLETSFPLSLVVVDFIPTAENIAKHLVTKVGPRVLSGTGVGLLEVTVEETRKCRATYQLT